MSVARQSGMMSSEDSDHPQLPTVDDVRRLLECVNAIHLAVPTDRPRVLAERLVALLGASVIAVDAGMPGETRRVATAAAAPALPRWTAVVKPVTGFGDSSGTASSSSSHQKGKSPSPTPPWKRGRGSGIKARPRHEVTLLSPAVVPAKFSDVRPAGVQSIHLDGDRLSAVSAWRAEPFDARHLMLLNLVHPPLAWIFAKPAASTGLPANTEAVLELMRRGMPEKEIAKRLGRSTHTVHAHVKRVYRHYAVRSRPELLARLFAEK